MTESSFPTFERPTFFDGQTLTAADLNAVVEYHRGVRWLHNRSFHGWGIATGLQVVGQRGERHVRVEPGHALDCLGRDLVVEDDVELLVPPVAASEEMPSRFHLVVSYQGDGLLSATSRRGPCGNTSAVRLHEQAAVGWKSALGDASPHRYRPGHDVALASVEVVHCALASDPSFVERRELGTTPSIQAGRTPSGATEWRRWPAEGPVLGVATTVRTDAAGFERTPRYMISVEGTRFVGANEGGPVVVDGVATVTAAGPLRFDVVVMLPTMSSALGPMNPQDRLIDPTFPGFVGTELGWCVSWLGVET